MRWEHIHLTPALAIDTAEKLLDAWDLGPVIYRFECDDIEAEAFITWPDITPFPIIHFNGFGCTLDTLAHELAHLVEGPDEATHGEDFDFLSEWVALELVDILKRGWGSDPRS